MNITSFNPLIVTPDAESAISLFEALGFEKRHTTTVKVSDESEVTNVVMRDANGFSIDIAQSPNTPRDFTLIRMNVSDFDEAYEALLAKGFKHLSGNIVEGATNKSAMLVSPSGFGFDLCQHIKD